MRVRPIAIGAGVVTAALMLVAVTATAAERATVDVLVSGKGNQYWPDATKDELTWVGFNPKTDVQHVFVKEFGKRKKTIGRSSWEGMLGSFYGRNGLVFQQFHSSRRGPISNLYVYNTKSGRTQSLGSPVNTAGWEYYPAASASGGPIMFLRCILNRHDDCKRTALLVYNWPGYPGKVRTVIHDIGRRTVFPGFAGAGYAAWTECVRRNGSWTCDVRVLDFLQDQIRRVYSPAGTHQYAPAIDEATGEIYFVQSADGCGRRVTVRRAALGETDSVILHRFNRGTEVGWTMSLSPSGNQHKSLYFQKWDCSRKDGSIVVIRRVDEL